MSFVERLPIEINGHYLRIKARTHHKKWVIRYIRKVKANDRDKTKEWRYRVELQCWGNTLEGCAERMLEKLKEYLVDN